MLRKSFQCLFNRICKLKRKNSAQFLEDVRNVMGIPEWFLEVDSRKTKLLYNNACVQMLIHFKGPSAARLEQVSCAVKCLKVFFTFFQCLLYFFYIAHSSTVNQTPKKRHIIVRFFNTDKRLICG